MPHRLHVSALVVLLAIASPVGAQPTTPTPEAGELAYQEGRRLYDLREWDRAIVKFKEAYELRRDAASLYNIAQAYRLEGDCVEALGFYKTYSRNFPTAQNLDKVEKFIADLEPCASAQAKLVKTEPTTAADASVVKPLPPKVSAADDHHTLAWSVIGAGGGMVVASVVVGALARSTWHDALSHCNAAHACDATGLALGDDARERATIATVVGVVGLSAVAVGVGVYVMGRSTADSVVIAPSIAPDRIGLALAGRF